MCFLPLFSVKPLLCVLFWKDLPSFPVTGFPECFHMCLISPDVHILSCPFSSPCSSLCSSPIPWFCRSSWFLTIYGLVFLFLDISPWQCFWFKLKVWFLLLPWILGLFHTIVTFLSLSWLQLFCTALLESNLRSSVWQLKFDLKLGHLTGRWSEDQAVAVIQSNPDVTPIKLLLGDLNEA